MTRPGPLGRRRAPSSSSTSSSSTMASGGIRRSGISAPGPSSDGWITKHRQLNPGVYEIGASLARAELGMTRSSCPTVHGQNKLPRPYNARRRPTQTAPDRDVLRVHRPCELPAVPVSVVVLQCTDQLSRRRHVDLKRRGGTGARRRDPERMLVGDIDGLLTSDSVHRWRHSTTDEPGHATEVRSYHCHQSGA